MVKVINATGESLTEEVIQAVQTQRIYWSDERRYHYFFDFKIGETWISCKLINNELTLIYVTLYKE